MKKVLASIVLILFSLCFLSSCKGKADIISESAYIEIEVDNSEETGELSYTEPLLVRDKEDIDELIRIINGAKKYSGEEFLDFESCPIVSFYLTSGSIMRVVASDYKGIFYTSAKKDFSDKQLYILEDEFALKSYIEALYNKHK